jgi:SEC-C motif-containing protein
MTHLHPTTAACPCGRTSGKGPKPQPLAYAACCQPWHAGEPAPDAEALMRSRYSAFVLGLVDHLQATWHASNRPAELTLESGVKWLGLEVRHHQRQDDTHATVEFVARSRVGGQGQRLHETSRFVKEDGRWFYVDGDLK